MPSGAHLRSGARRIAAGGPILAEQAVEDAPRYRKNWSGTARCSAKVVGESMVDAAICDGDWWRQQNVAENGDIVAAMIDGEATVKTFKRTAGQGMADAS